MDTNEFGSLLQEQSSDFEAAPEFGTDWFPKNEGEFVCLISSIRRVVIKSKGLIYPLWRIALSLLEGEEVGEEMPFILTGRDETGLGRIKAFISTLQGSKFTGDLPTANAVMEKALSDKLPLLCKYERKAKGEGKTGYYDNVHVQKVLAEIPPTVAG